MNKKWMALLLALCLTLTVTACGGAADQPAETPDNAVSDAPEDGDTGAEEQEPVQDVENTPEDETVASGTDDAQTPAEPEQETTQKPAVQPESKPETKPVQKPQENVPAERPETEKPADSGVDLTAFYQSLLDTYGADFPADANVSDSAELMDSFYPGLSAIGTRQVVIYQPMMSAVVCEIVLVEVENETDVQAVKDICQARIDYQVGDGTRPGGAWYPESMEGWEKDSRIVSNGKYVMLIAYSGCDDVVAAFNGLF